MDAFSIDPANVAVGQHLRTLREERGVSMRALARRSKLSANALSMIERGITSPSVATLTKLARALEVPITAFFRHEPPRNRVVFRQAGQRASQTFRLGVWESLGGEAFTGRIEAFLLRLDVGATSGAAELLHTGHELVYCLEGQVGYVVDGDPYVLNAGDSLIFAARLPHSWRNAGEEAARAIIVLAGFEESERPGEFHLASPMVDAGLIENANHSEPQEHN